MQLKRTNLNDKITDTIDDFNDNWANIEGSLELKADKQQEAWITPTLLNGCTGNVRFRKNEFGRIEYDGYVKAPGQVLAFNFPSGYGANDDFYFTTGQFSSRTAMVRVRGELGLYIQSATDYNHNIWLSTLTYEGRD